MKPILCFVILFTLSVKAFALELLCQDTSSFEFIDYKFSIEDDKAYGEFINPASEKLIKREYDVEETDSRFKLIEKGHGTFSNTVFINRISSNFYIASRSRIKDFYRPKVTSYGKCIKASDRVF